MTGIIYAIIKYDTVSASYVYARPVAGRTIYGVVVNFKAPAPMGVSGPFHPVGINTLTEVYGISLNSLYLNTYFDPLLILFLLICQNAILNKYGISGTKFKRRVPAGTQAAVDGDTAIIIDKCAIGYDTPCIITYNPDGISEIVKFAAYNAEILKIAYFNSLNHIAKFAGAFPINLMPSILMPFDINKN